ncbi:MAG: acyltransferase family protein [Bacteroidales bacterium]|nr:acyltransferase family protein [Bacteroidales bacterium]
MGGNTLTKQRIAWIDIAKGICIFAVMFGHIGVDEVNYVVYSFHLTVFFILSGYTARQEDLSKDYLNKKFRSLMVPYFVTCLCVTLMDVINQILYWQDASVSGIFSVVYNDIVRSFMASGLNTNLGSTTVNGYIGAIWFLPALFFALIMTQLLLKYIKKPLVRFAISLALMVAAILSSEFIWLPFSVQSAACGVFFILFGYELKQHADRFERFNWKHCLICLAVFLVCVFLRRSTIVFATASTDDLLLGLIASICSSLVILYVARHLGKCRPLAWVGRNSLLFLCVHLFTRDTLVIWINRLLEILRIPYNENVWPWYRLLFFIVSSILIVGLLRIIRRQVRIREEALPDRDRVASIDITRGIMITAVLVYLYIQDLGQSDFSNLLNTFILTAFVILSGFGFKPEAAGNLKTGILHIARTFLVPYAVFTVFFVILNGNISYVLDALLGLPTANDMYPGAVPVGPVFFFLMLFLTRVMYLLISRFSPNILWTSGIVLFLGVGGFVLGRLGVWLPWSLDCALFALIFYHIGYCFQKYRILEFFKNNRVTYFGLSILWAFLIWSGAVNFAVREYGSIALNVLGTCSALILIYQASVWLNRVLPVWCGRLIQLVGRCTVYLMVINALFDQQIQDLLGGRFSEGYLYHMILCLLIELAAGALLYIIHRLAHRACAGWIRKRGAADGA